MERSSYDIRGQSILWNILAKWKAFRNSKSRLIWYLKFFTCFSTVYIHFYLNSYFNNFVQFQRDTDNMIRIHDSTTMRYKCQNEIIAKDVNWCILDIAFSPGSEYFVYSTWSSCRKYLIQWKKKKTYRKMTLFLIIFFFHSVHLSRINGTSHQLKPLYLQPSKSSFCVFSLAFSNCGDQIIGGGSDGCLYIYDLVMAKRTFRCPVSFFFHLVFQINKKMMTTFKHVINF